MLVLNEWRYLIRQPLLLLAWVVLPLFAYIMTSGLSVDYDSYLIQFHLELVAFVLISIPIYVGVLGPIAFQRDHQHHMTELVQATAVHATTKTIARYVGFASLMFAQYTFAIAVVTISSFSLDVARIAGYFALFILLPTVLLLTALSLTLQNASLVTHYLFFVILFVVLLVATGFTGSPILAGSSVLNETYYNAMLWLDPYGFTALVAEFSESATPLTVELISNRLFILVLSLAIVGLVIKHSAKSMSAKTEKTARTVEHLDIDGQALGSPQNKTIQYVSRNPMFELIKQGFTHWRQLTATKVILVFWPILICHEIYVAIDYVEASSVLNNPTSLDALNRVSSDILPVFTVLLMIVWSWQVVSAFQKSKMDEFVAASPITNRQMVLAHIFTSWLIIVVLMGLTFIGSVAAEVLFGSSIDFLIYAHHIALMSLPLMLFSTFLICLQHIIRNKLVIGAVITGIVIFKFTPISTALGMTHTLWNIAGSPLQPADHFWGFTASKSVFWPYMQVWLFIAAALVCAAILFSHRGTFGSCTKIRFSKQPKLVALCVAAFIGFVGSAGYLHVNIVEERPLTFSKLREAWKADYEKEFVDWRSRPQPSIVNIDSHVDIFPEQELATFELEITLRNNTRQPITEFLLGRYGNFQQLNYEIVASQSDRNGEIKSARLNHTIISLKQPLQPAESMVIKTNFNYHQPKYWPGSLHQIIKPDFTYLRGAPILPVVGFQTNWTLRDELLRNEHQLPLLNLKRPSELFAELPTLDWDHTSEWVTYHSTISTKEGHQAVGNGSLIQQWTENNRSYFVYKTNGPIRPLPSWFSVPYEPQTSQLKNTKINVFAPTSAIESTKELHIKAMTDTLAWFDSYQMPYTQQQLNLFAVPSLGGTGYATPQNMLTSFRHGFLAKPSDDAGFDQRYRRAVHETAHQWFGHTFGNGVLKDSAFLVESLAKYIELVVIEQQVGTAATQALVEYETMRFERGNRHNYEKPRGLVDAETSYQMYSGATVAFAELRKEIGDEPIVRAIQELWTHHRYPNPPATSMHFVQFLKKHAEVQSHETIERLLLRN